jgi:hypothetical protein
MLFGVLVMVVFATAMYIALLYFILLVFATMAAAIIRKVLQLARMKFDIW